MADKSLFEKIADGEVPSYKVWEDDVYQAFLTPFANTLGFTVVTPKKNPGSNYTNVSDDIYTGLLLAAKKVAVLLQKAYNIQRVGLVIEGEGVPHLHIKLIPMHAHADGQTPAPTHTEFFEAYPGYLTTIEGPRMSDEQLAENQAKIQKAAA
jgi:histidine triad (HIT) family protein